MNKVLLSFICTHEPVGKPRMTRSDKWKKRDIVLKYYALADAIRSAAENEMMEMAEESQTPLETVRSEIFSLCNAVNIAFYLPIPLSTSSSKAAKMFGNPHNVRPDIDNLLKGVLDSLFEKDSTIFSISATKHYIQEGAPPAMEITLLHRDSPSSLDV